MDVETGDGASVSAGEWGPHGDMHRLGPFVDAQKVRRALAEIPKYYSDPWNSFGNKRCVSPWMTTEIQPNGDVATCRDHPDYVVGNIKDEPILKIFNNAKYRKFRQRLQTKGLFPVYARCCGLMGF